MRRLLIGVMVLSITLTLTLGSGGVFAQIGDGTSFEHSQEDGMWGYYKEIKVVVAQPSPLLLYVVYNIGSRGFILKVSGTGERDANMLNLAYQSKQVVTNSIIVGSQQFYERISDVSVIVGSTLVSFGSGKMLKIAGTGGTGHNMFNVTVDGQGFHTTNSKFTAHRLGDSYTPAEYDGVTSYAGWERQEVAPHLGRWRVPHGTRTLGCMGRMPTYQPDGGATARRTARVRRTAASLGG